MSTTWFYRRRLLVGLAVALIAAWYVVFEWDVVTYANGRTDEARCYSPNHEYYVVRSQTPFNALVADPLYVEGTAKLYDKTGTLLYKAKTLLSGMSGPMWFDAFAGDPPSVSYTGNSNENEPGGGWGYVLPTSPGKNPSGIEKRCF